MMYKLSRKEMLIFHGMKFILKMKQNPIRFSFWSLEKSLLI